MTRYTMGVDYGYGSDLSCYTLFDVKKNKMVWQWNGIGEPRFPWWLRLRMFFRQVTVMYESPLTTLVVESTPSVSSFWDEYVKPE